MLPANDDDPMYGVLELPNVSYTIHGAGHRISDTITIMFPDEAIDSLAARFSCAPDALVIAGEIVDGLRRIFGHDAVTVMKVLKSGGRNGR